MARRARGVAYLSVMLALAIIGLTAAHTVQLGAALSQHDAEEALLLVGLDFQIALQRYADATPVGLPRAPQRLEELLRDARHPGVVRHLRSLPPDPMTGQADWAVVRSPQGVIIGVHSRSVHTPQKLAGFHPQLAHLEGKRSSYSEWVFYGPPSTN